MSRSTIAALLVAMVLLGAAIVGTRGPARPGSDDTAFDVTRNAAATIVAMSNAEPAEEERDPYADLLDPRHERFRQQAPEVFQVRFETSAGPFTVEVHREWAPRGADRFYNLVRHGYYDEVRFFRVIEGFMAQFGIHGEPRVSAAWRQAVIPDDRVVKSNTRGTIVFATSGPNSRTTQLFINYANNARLDGMGFAPFGQVVEGMDAVDAIHSGYGEGAPRGDGPNQMRIQMEGNTYLQAEFPRLDHIITARIVEPQPEAEPDGQQRDETPADDA